MWRWKTVNKLAKVVRIGKVYRIDFSNASVKSSSKLNRDYIHSGKVEI